MTRPSEQEELLAGLEARATGLRRGSVVVFEVCVAGTDGAHVLGTLPVLIPDGSSRAVAGIRFTLRLLRKGPWRQPRGLARTVAAAAHNLRGGRRLGSVVILARRHERSWSA
jgi:hypothetical protein